MTTRNNFTKENQEAIIEALRKISETRSLSQISSEIGATVSKGTLSNVLNRKNLDKVSKSMWSRLAKYTQAGMNSFSWRILETQNYKLVTDTCITAMEEASMKMIIGKTGLGKTTALERFSKSNQNVAYVLLQRTMGVRDCLVAIAHAVGEPIDGTTNQLVKQVSKKLVERNGLLILDDCGKVIKKFYGVLQQIYDTTEGMTGIVLAGVPDLKQHLERNAARNKESYNELVSRISWTQQLYEPSSDIVKRICETNGITDLRAQNYVSNTVRDFRDLRNLITAVKRLDPAMIDVEVLKSLKVGGFYN